MQLTTYLDLVSRLNPANLYHYPQTFKEPASIPGRGKRFFSSQEVLTGPEALPDSCSKGDGGSFPGGTAAES
jgi:hypothetical protein